jgi:glutathione S-transferase
VPTLLHLPYSPWSERARWALDAKDVTYIPRRYQPVVGEPALRLQLGRRAGRQFGQWRGRVSVPVLFTAQGPLTDSLDIARWADAHGAGPTLFPSGSEEAMSTWCRRSDDALAAGRALALLRVVDDPAALEELTPPPLRRLGGVARRIVQAGTWLTRRKYGGHQRGPEAHRQVVAEALEALRAALASRPPGGAGEPKTLLDGFSYADITAAQMLVFVQPPAIGGRKEPGLRVGPANARAFTDPILSERFADLAAWRDDLYRRFRSVRGAT